MYVLNHYCCRNAWPDSEKFLNEGRTGGRGEGGRGKRFLTRLTNGKNRESRITDMKISFSRITKISK